MKYGDTVRIIKEGFYYGVLGHIINKRSNLAESIGRELFLYTVQSSLGIINVGFKEEDLDLIKK